MNRYIKSIKIKNFQSWKDETITFEPGLNLILGTSHSGKSAILRAISFVLYNYPNNNEVIVQKCGPTEAQVTLEFSDGVKVTRTKGGEDINEIMVTLPNGKKITKNKIGKDLPEEINKYLGYPPQDKLNGFISYSDQWSKMFLIDLSDTDLPRSLSSLTGIEILEESAKQLMQSYKSIEKQNKIDEKEYKSLLEESQGYSYVEQYEAKIKDLDVMLQAAGKLENKIDYLDKMLEFVYTESENQLKKCDTYIV